MQKPPGGATHTIPDQRFPYPEDRFITVGLLSGRMVIVVLDADRGRADTPPSR